MSFRLSKSLNCSSKYLASPSVFHYRPQYCPNFYHGVQCKRSFFTVVNQYQKGVTFTFGRLTTVKGPGLRLCIPVLQDMWKVDMREILLTLDKQFVITSDNSTISVDAVVSFQIKDAEKFALNVANGQKAVSELSQLKLREVLSHRSLDEILSQREQLSADLVAGIKEKCEIWGVVLNSINLKDIKFDDSMVRAMSKKAEALREREAQVIAADAEVLTAKKYAEAAQILESQSGAMYLRSQETLLQLGKEKNTIIVPSSIVDKLQCLKN